MGEASRKRGIFRGGAGARKEGHGGGAEKGRGLCRTSLRPEREACRMVASFGWTRQSTFRQIS